MLRFKLTARRSWRRSWLTPLPGVQIVAEHVPPVHAPGLTKLSSQYRVGLRIGLAPTLRGWPVSGYRSVFFAVS